jgi:hypothetical protein
MSSLGCGLPFIAEVALTRGQAVVFGSAYGTVALPAEADDLILGFAVNDAGIGQEVAIHPVTDGSSKCKALVGTDGCTRGDVLVGDDATGGVATLTPGVSLQYACGIALETGIAGQLVDVLPCFFIQVGAGA